MAMVASASVLSAAASAQTRDASPLPVTAAAQSIEITLRPQWSGDTRHFAITIAFDAAGRHETRVRLPEEWAGADGLHRGIRNLRAVSKDTRVSGGAAQTARVVRHPRTGRVTLAYELIDFGGNDFRRSRLYQPQLEPTYALFFGRGAWVLPDWDEQQTIDLGITVRDLPEGWSVASSFGAGAHASTVRWAERGQHAAVLRYSLYAFGDFRLHRADIEGRPVWIGLRGRNRFDDATFVERSARLIRAHRAFFNDFATPHLLITVMPNGIDDATSYGGTAVYRAFAMHVSDDFTVPGPGFDFLVGHEHLHTWLPQRFGTMKSPQFGDDALRYWFSEGFTNWLTHRLLLASGTWTLHEYARELSDVVRRYESSGARSRLNRDVPGLFFTNNEIGQLPYQRGELLALHWDAALAARGGTLARVLRALVLPPPPYTQPPPLATERLLTALERELGPGVRDELDRWIEQAQPFPYVDAIGGPCLAVQRVAIGRYELGFASQSIDQRRISGVVDGSAAQRAGLREGDVLKGFSVRLGDVSRDVELQVERDGELVGIRYRPATAQTVPGVQFDVRPGAENDAACRAWIAMQ